MHIADWFPTMLAWAEQAAEGVEGMEHPAEGVKLRTPGATSRPLDGMDVSAGLAGVSLPEAATRTSTVLTLDQFMVRDCNLHATYLSPTD